MKHLTRKHLRAAHERAQVKRLLGIPRKRTECAALEQIIDDCKRRYDVTSNAEKSA